MPDPTLDQEVDEHLEREEQLPGEVRPIRMPRLLVAASEFSWRFLICVAAGGIVVYALTRISFAVIPVLLALLLATLLAPPVRALERRRWPSALATLLVFVVSLSVLGAVIAAIAPSVAGEFERLPDQLRTGADRLAAELAGSPFNLDQADLQREIDRIDERITENSGAITSGVLSGVQFAATLATELIVTLVLTFFFVKDGPGLWRWALGLFPERRREMVTEIGEASWRVLGHYVRGVAFVAAFDAVFIGIALALIGVPLVLPLAIITFFAAFVPLVGAVVAGAVAALVALAFEGIGAALLVVGAIILVQQLEGNLIYPFVVGKSVELHPIAILLAVTIGAILAGIVGAAIAVPVAAVLSATIVVVKRETDQGEVAVGPRPEMPLRELVRQLPIRRAGARRFER
jgi:putative heme transporter